MFFLINFCARNLMIHRTNHPTDRTHSHTIVIGLVWFGLVSLCTPLLFLHPTVLFVREILALANEACGPFGHVNYSLWSLVP